MFKHLSLLFLLFSLCSSLTAQMYTAARAAAIVPDAVALRYDDGNSLPKYIGLAEAKPQPMADAAAYLRTYLRLPEAYHFELIQSETDAYGITHQRYRQTVNGYPVVGGVYLFHGKDGYWTQANGSIQLPDPASEALLISPEEALYRAIQLRPATVYGWETEIPLADYPSPVLTWVPYELDFRPGNFRLAYEIYLYRAKPHSHERLFIDAATGQLVAVEDQIHYHNTPGQARTRNSGLRDIITTYQGDSTYVLQETTRGKGIFTYNALGQAAYPYADFHDDDNFWENVNAQKDEVATDCHWGAEKFYDLLLRLNRNSIDNEGEALESHVHYGENLANAFWDGRRASFGDGAANAGIDLPSISLDVVAHEFTHGLTNRTSRLIYSNESGGLNESFSDIFGAATNFTFRPEVANWRVGSDVTRNAQGIRSMEDPNIFGNPKAYQGQFWVDGGGVHNNSGPSNHWFYLLTEGGSGVNEFGTAFSINGIGLDAALEVAYRNNAFYLTESSTYRDAAFNSLLAAASAFGSCASEIDEIIAAWQAVNITVALPNQAIAAFRVDGPFCNLDDTVRFVNSSLGDSYVWDFGDGNSSIEQSPEHVYSHPGAYTIQLSVADCNGNTDTLVQTAAVLLDPDNVYCAFDTMPVADTLTIAKCRGVLFDSGGPRARYQNQEASLLTIENPDGTPITLTFIRFRTEIFSDRLTIYDGATTEATELAVLSGALQPAPLTSSGASLTLRWSSNSSGTDDGWEIRWGASSSNRPPDASFIADRLVAALNQPITFSGTAAVPGPLTYDFGDGSPLVFAAAATEHTYSQAGQYRVIAYDANCHTADTAYLDVSVQAGVSLSVSPTHIIDTLEVGQTSQHLISAQNESSRTSYFRPIFPDFSPIDIVSNRTFSLGNRSTNHRFSDLPDWLPNARLSVFIDGDFGSSGKQAAVQVEGELVAVLGGVPNPDSRRLLLQPSREQLAAWLADGQIDVEVRSANTVSTLGFANLHRVTFSYDRIDYLRGSASFQDSIGANSSVQYPLQIVTEALRPGDYIDTLFLFSSNAEQARIPVVVQLHLMGRPIAQLDRERIDFGFLRILEAGSQELTLTNIGSENLELSAASLTDPRFSSDFSPTTLAPQDRVSIRLTFIESDEMALAGASLSFAAQDELILSTNAGTLTIPLTATVAVPPQAFLSQPEDTLVVRVEAGSTKDTSLIIRNLATVTPLQVNVAPGRYSAQSEQFFTADQNSTIHLFTALPRNSTPFRMLLVLQGDFSSTAERIRYFFNGINQGLLNDNNLSDNESDSLLVDIPPAFTANGALEVRIENSAAVAFDPAFANRHLVNLFQPQAVPWLQTPSQGIVLSPNDSLALPLRLDATLLNAGIYESLVSILTNDPAAPQQFVPLRMIVSGAPQLSLAVDSLQFGSWQMGTSAELPLLISNLGTDSLVLTSLSFDDPQFSTEAQNIVIAPRSGISLPIRFTPSALGSFSAQLTLEGPRIASRNVPLFGQGLAAAELVYAPLDLDIFLLSSQDTSFRSLLIGNTGNQDLRYQIGQSLGQLLVWTYALNEGSYNANVAGLIATTPGISASSTATTDPGELRAALTAAEVLFIPDMQAPDAAVLERMQRPIADFLSRGGRLILLGGESGDVPLKLGLLSGSVVRSNPGGLPVVLTPADHPLFLGLPDTLTSIDRSSYLVNGPQQTATVLGRMFGNPCIITRQLAYGELIYLGYSFESNSPESQQLLANALRYAIRPAGGNFPAWLQIQAENGLLAPGSSADHQISLNARGLAEGTYTYHGFVRSNAPRTVPIADSLHAFNIRMHVRIDTKVSNVSDLATLEVYPNPTADKLYLQTDWPAATPVIATLLDSQGRVMKREMIVLGGNTPVLDLADLPSGTYQLLLQTAQGQRIAAKSVVR